MLLTAALFALFGLQDNSAEIGRLQAEVSRLSSELDRTQAVLQAETRPFCSAQIHLQGGLLRVTTNEIPLRTNVLSMVSTPSDCLPGDIRVTATFFTSNETFVCSGTVGIPQFQPVQNTSVEFRPYETETFLKWWEGPTLKQQSLICKDFQGNELRNPSDSSASLRIYVSVFPRRGGLATTEIQLALPRSAQRP